MQVYIINRDIAVLKYVAPHHHRGFLSGCGASTRDKVPSAGLAAALPSPMGHCHPTLALTAIVCR
jgi:hypothetical protein